MARQRAAASRQNNVDNSRQQTGNIEPSDTGESQEVFALSHLLRLPKMNKEIQQFQEKVTGDQEKLEHLLQEQVHKAKDKGIFRREELVSSFTAALKSPPRCQGHETGSNVSFAGTKITGNTVYTSITSVVASSEDLIKEYRRLDGMIAEMRPENPGAIAAEWSAEIKQADGQLKLGARVALRNVKKVLGAEVENDDVAVTDAEDDVDMVDSEDTEKNRLNFDLYTSLRYAERGVTRMAKGLPSDEAL
ncbi:hypothetical protein ACN47E_002101 [Coniothyrium glycines]